MKYLLDLTPVDLTPVDLASTVDGISIKQILLSFVSSIYTNIFLKAFGAVEWYFLYKTLQFFCSWIKTFYNDISRCIINNGHCSDYFKLGRGFTSM
jgi:hypothetical protein